MEVWWLLVEMTGQVDHECLLRNYHRLFWIRRQHCFVLLSKDLSRLDLVESLELRASKITIRAWVW